MLSQNNRGGLDWEMFSSFRRFLNQSISTAVLTRALYSASVEDLATVFCLTDFQETRLEQINKILLVVEVQSSRLSV